MKQQTINFKRGPDKGQRDTRSDKGKRRKPFSGVKKNIKKRVDARQERVAARKELAAKKADLERRKTDLELEDVRGEQRKRAVKSAVDTAKLGTLATGVVGTALLGGTKSGRRLVKNTLIKGKDKIKQEAKDIGSAVGEGIKEAVPDSVKTAGNIAKEYNPVALGQKARVATEQVKDSIEETGKKVVKKAQDDIETTKRVVNREPKPYGEQWKGSTNSSSSTSAPARSKGLRERLAEARKKDQEARAKLAKRFGFNEFENPEVIEFAEKKKTKKKKNVKVKSYRRKDGTVVKASTRKVEANYEPEASASRRIGTALHNIGTGLIPVASAAATAAGAYGTILGAKDRHRVINRDLSALGESRKFLALGGSIGNLSRGVGTVGLTRRKLADRERRTAIYEKSQNLFERKLGIEDRKEDRLGS